LSVCQMRGDSAPSRSRRELCVAVVIRARPDDDRDHRGAVRSRALQLDALAVQRHGVTLDQRVRQELLAHLLDLGQRFRLVLGGDIDVDQPADGARR